ncbi:MAG: DUF3822 family protein [Mangrovibacterium sp.]
MQRLSLVDESFDLNLTKEYILSIQVSLDGFSFSVLDSMRKKVICLFHQDTFTSEPAFHLKRINTIYDEVDLLSLSYKKTKIYFSAPGKTTLVPIAVFDQDLAENFYRTTIDAGRNSKILFSLVPDMASYAIYEVDQAVYALLQEKHPESVMQNDLVLSAYGCPPGIKLVKIRILRKQLVILTLNDQINFYNSYYYEGENDMLYYILGVIKNMDLKPEAIILDGMINKHESIYYRLKQYFEHVDLTINNPRIYYSHLLDHLPDSRFINLFNSFSFTL